MAIFSIHYRKYNIFANKMIPYIKVVSTSDIYHEIGKLVSTSIEKIEINSYVDRSFCTYDYESFWIKDGYRSISHNLWVLDYSSAVADDNK